MNVIDFDALDLPAPSYVYDFPHGAGRYVQGATGYDYTLVNGQVFMDHGEHTGAFAGTMLKNRVGDAVSDTVVVRLPSLRCHRRRDSSTVRANRVVLSCAPSTSAKVESSRSPSTSRR